MLICGSSLNSQIIPQLNLSLSHSKVCLISILAIIWTSHLLLFHWALGPVTWGWSPAGKSAKTQPTKPLPNPLVQCSQRGLLSAAAGHVGAALRWHFICVSEPNPQPLDVACCCLPLPGSSVSAGLQWAWPSHCWAPAAPQDALVPHLQNFGLNQ